MTHDVYICGIQTHLPQLHDSQDIVAALYHPDYCDQKVSKIANRLSSSVGIQQRAISIDLSQWPHIVVPPDNHPACWGQKILDKLLGPLGPDQIQFLSLSYNVTSHQNFVPNLASQISGQAGLGLHEPPQEIVNYGCASGLFSLDAGWKSLRQDAGAGFTMVFEQSSAIFNPVYDLSSALFRPTLKGHALFGDAGAGLLLVSGETATHFSRKVRIVDIALAHSYGTAIQAKDGYFLVGEAVKDVMPPLASEKVILPVLQRHGLSVDQISQWSIHQGGLPVLDRFADPDVLGIDPDKLEPSARFFRAYGNVSTPSNMLVFEDHFRQGQPGSGDYGMIVGFGAGYYMGALLYQWC